MSPIIIRTNLFILLLLACLQPMANPNSFVFAKDSITYSSTCVNSTIQFGSNIFDILPFPQSISWDFGDPSSGIYNHAASQQALHSYLSTGTYTVNLTVVNVPGDTVKLSSTINIISPLAYNFGPDIYLCGKQDTLLAAPSIAGAVYTWNNPDTVHTDTLRVTKSGVYTVSINGCGVNDSIGVYISTKPAIDLGADHIMCDSSNLTLDASTQNGYYTWMLNGNILPTNKGQIVTEYPGGTYVAIDSVPGCGIFKDSVNITYSLPIASYFSIGPDTLLCPKQLFSLNAIFTGATAFDWSNGSTASQIQITEPGRYWVFVTYNGQCQVTDTVNITYIGDLKLDFHDTSICQGNGLVLNANFGQGTYNWTAIPPQRDDQNQTGQSVYYVYKSGTYAVTATVGQCVYKDTVKVNIDDSLHVTMTKDTLLCNGEDFMLEVTGNFDSLFWQNGLTTNIFPVTDSGTYQVIAKNGCGSDTLSAKISYYSCACSLLLPNAFTPNGDGLNESFRPLHPCQIANFHMAIFNRYGQKVFESSDPERGWDGRLGGLASPPGNYVWMASYINTTTNKRVNRKGSVLLIR
ncbi:MAG: gliding motility-associated C-terminal domain-containing protein [Bacteroidetes bacterium]|nr:gliding motility-associated C-terminal domain-containing protein [Bacteroidota bacterium]